MSTLLTSPGVSLESRKVQAIDTEIATFHLVNVDFCSTMPMDD